MEQNSKVFDLEERSAAFAEVVRNYCLRLPRNVGNNEYASQLIRSASSVGANYIEANERLGTKDFKMKIRICIREAKESAYWLRLTLPISPEMENDRNYLKMEARELVLIFSAILNKAN